MLDKEIKFTINHKMKLIYSEVVKEKYSEKYFEEGTDNSKILVVYSKLLPLNKIVYSYKETDEYRYLTKIFNFCNLEEQKVKVTSFYKVFQLKNIHAPKTKDFYDVLVYQMLRDEIEYIVLIGFENAKQIFKMYLQEMKAKEEDINKFLDRLSINSDLKQKYTMYNKKIIIIPEKTQIQKFSNIKKQELIDALKQMKEV